MFSLNVVIALNKPEGVTSQQAVTRVKRLFGVKKAGHAGTLDPLATGVLLVCLGEATKISRFLMDNKKEYRARMQLGIRTDTLDSEGTVTEIRNVPHLSSNDIQQVAREFTGRIMQKPPMYSALKHEGRPLYALARKGITVERALRPVDIYSLSISAVQLPYVDLIIHCSKGTYIRTLCDDLGERLGTLAHLTSLVRTRTGIFSLERTAGLDQLSVDSKEFSAAPYIYSIDEALSEFAEVIVREEDYHRIRNGMSISAEDLTVSGYTTFVRLKTPSGKLFGIGKIEN
ncbi:MAG TPA: tRNA pseudouridine(55) synthase TruB, partial [Thermodesulfovibrionales bacterium]|nr:tRNA pseudouridine(55) synthase TruB [Thermodesulfovibrionales bacterium]